MERGERDAIGNEKRLTRWGPAVPLGDSYDSRFGGDRKRRESSPYPSP